MKTYFIHGDKEAKLDIPELTLMPRINGKTYLYSLRDIEAMIDSDWDIFQKPEVQGQFFTHIKIWKNIVEHQTKEALIIEDIVSIPEIDNFETNVKKVIDNAPKEYEVICLGTSLYGHQPIIPVNKYVAKSSINHGVGCYIISLKGVQNMLKHYEERGMYRSLDGFFMNYLQGKQKYYVSIKVLSKEKNTEVNLNNNRAYNFDI